jgi:hypothetical protein
MSTKRCPQCGDVKDRDLFNKNRAQPDGLQTRCRKCAHGVDEKTCIEPDCEIAVHGRHHRCDEHQAEQVARARAAAAEADERTAAAALRKAEAAQKARADEEFRKIRRCVECDGPIPARVKLDAKYCGKACRDAVNKRRLHEGHRAGRKVVERACDGCGTDITERATQHPLATRCEDCQANHRSGRKRVRPKVERSCAGCGADIRGRAKAKTTCADCEPRPPRLCVGCGSVDLRGTMRWRCEECQDAWDAGESGRVRQWQADNPAATMLIRARTRAKRKGLECTITLDDVKAAWPNDNRCPVYKVELVRNLGEHHASPESPSLDRIDNSKGYVPGNVWVISLQANGTKQDFSLEKLAAGESTPEWRAYARTYLGMPRRRVVRRRTA